MTASRTEGGLQLDIAIGWRAAGLIVVIALACETLLAPIGA